MWALNEIIYIRWKSDWLCPWVGFLSSSCCCVAHVWSQWPEGWHLRASSDPLGGAGPVSPFYRSCHPAACQWSSFIAVCSLLPGEIAGRGVWLRNPGYLLKAQLFPLVNQEVESQVQKRRRICEWGQGGEQRDGILGIMSLVAENSRYCSHRPGFSALCYLQRQNPDLLREGWGLVWKEHFKRQAILQRVCLVALLMIQQTRNK